MFIELIMKQKPQDLLKSAREAKGLTQTNVADELGLGLRMYQRIEAGLFPKYKSDTIKQLDIILGTNVYDIVYGNSVSHETKDETAREKSIRKPKTASTPYMVPFIPVKAQAGYVKAIDQEVYLDTLEKYALPPGVSAHGAIWRYWEVEGDSMEPTFKGGDIVLTSFVHPMDWENIRNFYTYVIVTQERVLIKRIYCKNQLEWVLISDNEDMYGQQLLPVESIKEVWVYRKTWSTRAAPPKEFKITV